MSERALRFVVREQLREVGLVAFGDAVAARLHRGASPVLRVDAGKPAEGVEADDAPREVVGFVDSAQRREQGEVLSPPHPELHDHAVDGHDLTVELLEEEESRQGLSVQEETLIGQALRIGNRALAHHLHEGEAPTALLGGARSAVDDGQVHDGSLQGNAAEGEVPARGGAGPQRVGAPHVQGIENVESAREQRLDGRPVEVALDRPGLVAGWHGELPGELTAVLAVVPADEVDVGQSVGPQQAVALADRRGG
ncbi:MAG: hypothetical protein ACK55I_23140, partial [bacterium]